MSEAREVVVTGGTGALGREIAAAFLEAGDRIFVPWIAKSERDAVAERFASAVADGRLSLFEADVAEAHGAAELARQARTARVLVAAAGGFAGGSPVHETELEVWDRMLRLNLRTAVSATRALLPGMLERRDGVVIYVSSQAARRRPAGIAAYAASKAGLVVLTEALQKEVADRGVRVNAVAPDTIDTPANRRAMPDADPSTWTPPGHIAEVVRWLASDAAATVRGAVIPV